VDLLSRGFIVFTSEFGKLLHAEANTQVLSLCNKRQWYGAADWVLSARFTTGQLQDDQISDVTNSSNIQDHETQVNDSEDSVKTHECYFFAVW